MKKHIFLALSTTIVTSMVLNNTQNVNATSDYYTVLKGDTLFSISKKLGIKQDEIISLNKIEDNKIKVGQNLIVATVSATKEYLTTTNLNLRKSNTTNSSILTTIPKNKKVEFISSNGNWYKVKYNNKTGFVNKTYLTEVKKETNNVTNVVTNSSSVSYKYTTTSSLNMRKGAGTSYSKITTIPNNKEVTYISKSGKWFKVKYNNMTGWVSSDYIKTTTVKKDAPVVAEEKIVNDGYKYTTTSSLNMRKGAGTSYSKITTIPNNKEVSYISKSGKWFKVKYNNMTGWVSSDYIKKTKIETKSAETKPVETKPVETKPVETEPVETKPVETKPVETKPVETKPVVELLEKYIVESSSGLNLREKPGISGVTLATMPDLTIVEVTGKTETVNNVKWMEVKYNGKIGWSSSAYLTKYNESEIYVSSTTFYNWKSTNLYKTESTSSTKLDTVNINSKLEFISKSSNYYKVKYNGKTGYILTTDLISSSNMKRINDLENNKKSYLFMDLRTESSVKADQINNYIKNWMNTTGKKNSVLENKGQVFIDAGKKYGVNALYLAAHAVHESAYGTSVISLERNNLFGYGAYDKIPYLGAVKFKTIDENIYFVAETIKSGYLGKDYRNQGEYLGYSVKDVNGNRIPSLSKGMNFYYASDEKWGEKILKHMTNMMEYSKEEARNKKPETSIIAAPSYPDYSDVFENDTNLIMKTKVTLYSSKSTSATEKIDLSAGDKVIVLEKSNNYWMKVLYKGKNYYINGKTMFVNYSDYFYSDNLARLSSNVNSENKVYIKKNASSSSENLVTLDSGTFVTVVLENGKKVTSNGMYKVKYGNKIGWINTSNVYFDFN